MAKAKHLKRRRKMATLTEIMEEYERLGKLIKELADEMSSAEDKERTGKLSEEEIKAEAKKTLNLLDMGHLAGKQFLIEMIAIYYQYPTDLIFGKKLYVMIAEKSNSNYATVRECIKYAIETTYDSGNQKMLQSIVGYDSEEGEVPSNEQFVAAIVDYINTYVG